MSSKSKVATTAAHRVTVFHKLYIHDAESCFLITTVHLYCSLGSLFPQGLDSSSTIALSTVALVCQSNLACPSHYGSVKKNENEHIFGRDQKDVTLLNPKQEHISTVPVPRNVDEKNPRLFFIAIDPLLKILSIYPSVHSYRFGGGTSE